MKLKKVFEKYTKEYSYDLNKIVGINPFDFDMMYLLDNGKLSQISKNDVKEEYLLSSFIPNKNILSYELKIQKNLLDKIEIEDYIETKAYEEMSLDEVEEYIFKYKMINLVHDDKYVLFEVIIISKKEIEEYYESIKKNYGYLDFITYSGYIYNVLYKEKILDKRNDLFIYFTSDEIIITLYGEGEFLQTFIIPDGLQSIYEELGNNIRIKNFDFDKFLFVLRNKGLDINNYTEKEEQLFNILTELFSNTFITISTQLHSITRKFSLTTIDRIFMSGIKGSIPGISDFANMYLGVEANDLKFDIDYNPENIEIDQILFLSMLYASSAYKNDNQQDNFTIYYRPPTFFYRPSGQFISISIASLLLSLVYPTYQIIDTYLVNIENQELETKLNNLKHINKKLKNNNKHLTKQLKLKKEEKNNLLKYIKDREVIIDDVYKEKKGYVPKAKLISLISKYLYDNKVYLSNLSYGHISFFLQPQKNKKINKNLEDKSSKVILDVYAKDSKNITNFINDIIESEHLIVNTPGYIKTNNFYKAKIMIKVER